MRERPILFSAPMVRAILAGNKTKTRRALKHRYANCHIEVQCGIPEIVNTSEPDARTELFCPYGRTGDRLWVRETFRGPLDDGSYGYRATHTGPFTWESYTWKPSIHMPRVASRITLAIGGVRLERLQDISGADALAEGIVQLKDGGYGLPAGEHYHAADPRQSYFSLWESINGPGSVEVNPWVWVVEFRRQQA